MDEKDLYAGLIKLHILYHAVHEPIFGLGIIEELARHGYRISAGTLYPMLHGMERRGYVQSRDESMDGRRRRVYTATALGKRALTAAKLKVSELFGELFEEEPTKIPRPKENRHGRRK
ncbi:MAG: helix-turn-helix transcriptional regulator [Candidatus Hydrogenedentes bacterium]|nr:helix-turn-helix transcriptional regulator [Candidatus Hydrogenedentota bacterium]